MSKSPRSQSLSGKIQMKISICPDLAPGGKVRELLDLDMVQ